MDLSIRQSQLTDCYLQLIQFNMANSKDIAGFLVILHPAEIASRIPFFYGNNVIGRSDSKATIVIKEISISQKHAALYAAPGKITITDIGSKNGTKINGEANLIQQGKQVSVDESMVIYFADVKCRIEIAPMEPQQSKSLKRAQLMQLINQQQKLVDKQQYRDNYEIKEKKVAKDQFQKPNIKDDFNIDQGFDPIKAKDLKADKKKESKKEQKNIETKPNQIKVNEQDKIKGKEMTKKDKKDQKKEEKKQAVQQESVEQEHLQKKQVNFKVSLNKKEELCPQTSLNPRQKNAVETKLETNSTRNIKPTKKQNKKKSPTRSPSKRKSSPKKQGQKKLISNPKMGIKTKEASSPPKPKGKSNEEQLIVKKNIKKSKQKQQDKKQQTNKRKSKDERKSPSPKRQEVVSKQRKPKGRPSKNKNSSLQEPESKEVKTQAEENTTKKKYSRKRKLSDYPNEGIKLRNSELVMYPRRNFIGKRILCSNFYPQFNRKFFVFVQNPFEEFDYLVMKDYKRTFKALLAICRGIPIVRYNWVQQSEMLEKTLKYHYYTFKDLEYIYKAIQKTAQGFRVFEGYQIYLASKEYHMKNEQIEALIDATGGKIVRKFNKELSKTKKNGCIALVRNNSEDNRQQLSDEIKQAKKQGFQTIHMIEFLLDACEKQQIDWSCNDAFKLRF